MASIPYFDYSKKKVSYFNLSIGIFKGALVLTHNIVLLIW